MVVEKPRLLYQVKTSRTKYFRKFLWAVPVILASIAAVTVLTFIDRRNVINSTFITIGQIVGIGAVAVFTVRAYFNMTRSFMYKDEAIRFFDRGFQWKIKDQAYKYSYSQIKKYYKTYRKIGIRFLNIERGGLIFEMADGNTFMFKPLHGDPDELAAKIDPVIDDIIGSRMARALRDGRSVKINDDLVLASQGVIARGKKIRWQNVDFAIDHNQLLVQRINDAGRFQSVATFPTASIANLGGVMDVVEMVIQNYQPERFGIETQVGKVYFE